MKDCCSLIKQIVFSFHISEIFPTFLAVLCWSSEVITGIIGPAEPGGGSSSVVDTHIPHTSAPASPPAATPTTTTSASCNDMSDISLGLFVI